MRPRLVLHVGAPKTGSTYLQKRLRADPARLRAGGIHVPVLPHVAQMAGNAKLLATALSREPSPTFRRNFPALDRAALDPRRIAAELLAGWQRERETVVLSAENFQPAHARRLRELVPEPVDCTVVLCVRRQDRWIESYHNQLVKVGELGVPLSSFVATVCDGADERYCHPDWYAAYETWRATFGTCNVVFYDQARDELFVRFMAAAGLTVPAGLADIDPVQVSLDAHQLAYLLALERPLDFAEFVRRRGAAAEAARRLGPPGPRSLLSGADRARLRERFAASNLRLLAALGVPPERHPLDLPADDPDAWSPGELDASPAYARYRALADAIYAGRA